MTTQDKSRETPTPEQIAEWRKEGNFAYGADNSVRAYTDTRTAYTAGYIYAKTEQATEISELKTEIAELRETLDIVSLTAHNNHDFIVELLPLAKFGAYIQERYTNKEGWYFGPTELEALSSRCGLIQTAEYEIEFAPNIEATITKLLKD